MLWFCFPAYGKHGRSEEPGQPGGLPIVITEPVLATCGIRRPELACENTSCCLLLLADSPKEAYNLKHASAHLDKGGMDTVQRILTFITRLTRFCLQSLHHRYITWTIPGPTSLLLLTLTDLSRSKSGLVAENALLRQQPIILRRQVKRSRAAPAEAMDPHPLPRGRKGNRPDNRVGCEV
jgi:hypothetical protein